MKIQESIMLLSLGLIIWILGTIYRAYANHRVLESTPAQYWCELSNLSPSSPPRSASLFFCWRQFAGLRISRASTANCGSIFIQTRI